MINRNVDYFWLFVNIYCFFLNFDFNFFFWIQIRLKCLANFIFFWNWGHPAILIFCPSLVINFKFSSDKTLLEPFLQFFLFQDPDLDLGWNCIRIPNQRNLKFGSGPAAAEFPTLHSIYDLPEIEIALPEIKTALPEIETNLCPRMNLDLQQLVSISGRVVLICSRSEKYFQEVRKIFIPLVALNVQNWLDWALISHYLSMVILPN